MQKLLTPFCGRPNMIFGKIKFTTKKKKCGCASKISSSPKAVFVDVAPCQAHTPPERLKTRNEKIT